MDVTIGAEAPAAPQPVLELNTKRGRLYQSLFVHFAYCLAGSFVINPHFAFLTYHRKKAPFDPRSIRMKLAVTNVYGRHGFPPKGRRNRRANRVLPAC